MLFVLPTCSERQLPFNSPTINTTVIAMISITVRQARSIIKITPTYDIVSKFNILHIKPVFYKTTHCLCR
jgi:hypothetical protein